MSEGGHPPPGGGAAEDLTEEPRAGAPLRNDPLPSAGLPAQALPKFSLTTPCLGGTVRSISQVKAAHLQAWLHVGITWASIKANAQAES